MHLMNQRDLGQFRMKLETAFQFSRCYNLELIHFQCNMKVANKEKALFKVILGVFL